MGSIILRSKNRGKHGSSGIKFSKLLEFNSTADLKKKLTAMHVAELRRLNITGEKIILGGSCHVENMSIPNQVKSGLYQPIARQGFEKKMITAIQQLPDPSSFT